MILGEFGLSNNKEEYSLHRCTAWAYPWYWGALAPRHIGKASGQEWLIHGSSIGIHDHGGYHDLFMLLMVIHVING